ALQITRQLLASPNVKLTGSENRNAFCYDWIPWILFTRAVLRCFLLLDFYFSPSSFCPCLPFLPMPQKSSLTSQRRPTSKSAKKSPRTLLISPFFSIASRPSRRQSQAEITSSAFRRRPRRFTKII